jgi:hypothetical protein
MLAKLSEKISGCVRAQAGVFATLLIAAFSLVSPVNGQNAGESFTPWQNPPREYTYRQAGRLENPPVARETAPPDVPVPKSLSSNSSDPSPANDVEDGSESRIYRQESCTAPDCGGDCGNYCDSGCAADRDCFPCFSQFYQRLWFSGEYISWWGKSTALPPLATANTSGASTDLLLGGDNLDYDAAPGGRFALGYWLDPCRDVSIEAIYTFLGNKATTSTLSSDNYSIIARPFYDVYTARQDVVLVAYPNLYTGTLNFSLAGELSSVEALLRKTCYRQCNRRVDFLLGYRYGRFQENLSIASTSRLEALATTTQFSDIFSTSNDFNGAELGFVATNRYCRWTTEFLAKLAIGNTKSTVTIDGNSSVTDANGNKTTYPHDGFLALPTNIGIYTQNGFSVIPELGVTVGFNVTCRLKATVGYTLLYWSRVTRPADQIDTYLNSTQMLGGAPVGVTSPRPGFVTTDFWAQGINAGLEYQF